ncbi:MAG: hypothetical protein HUJ59_03140 [Bacilli bacterium]|nr:hypothetical protein [Bacilli bacterium]
MAKLETRVDKYKEYRDSMIKEDAIALDSVDESKTHLKESGSTTTALPLEQVMGIMQHDKQQVAYMRKKKAKKALLIAIPCLIGAIIVAALIIIGIKVFGGN